MNRVKIVQYLLILNICFVGYVLSDDTIDVPTPNHEEEEEEHHEPPKYVVTNEIFLDVEIRPTKTSEAIKSGRIVIGLFGDICPMTATNFLQLAKGFKRDNVNCLIYFLLAIDKILKQLIYFKSYRKSSLLKIHQFIESCVTL